MTSTYFLRTPSFERTEVSAQRTLKTLFLSHSFWKYTYHFIHGEVFPRTKKVTKPRGKKASGWPKLPMRCIREVTKENNKTRRGLWYECAPLLSFWGNCWPWVIIRKRCEPQIKIQNQQQLGSWDYPEVMRRGSLRWGARQHRGGEEPSL